MLAGGITVPAYTTYTEKDYKYLIEDCQPSVIIVSNEKKYNLLVKQNQNFFDDLQNFVKHLMLLQKLIQSLKYGGELIGTKGKLLI